MATCQEHYGRECKIYEDFGTGNPTPGWHWLKGILLETGVLIVLYQIVFFRMLRPYIEAFYKSDKSTWQYMTTYTGIFHKNVQIEVVYFSLLGIHHLIGGGLMVYGYYTSNPAIWVQGAIIDLVDAVHDTALMILPAWPFNARDPKIVILMLPHHAFSLVITIPAICTGIYLIEDAQAIGACLLAAGAISCFALCYVRTRDRTDPCQAWQEAIGWVFAMTFFNYCRFYVFNKHAYNFISAKWGGMEMYLKVCSVLVALFMTFFNVMVGLDGNLTMVARIKTALNGGAKKDK